jgi:hypothetical protein
MQAEYIEPDRWHDKKLSQALRLQQLYGTPRSWFRRSLHIGKSADLVDLHDAADEQSIRCAAIFARKTSLHTLDNCWSVTIWPRIGWTCGVQKDWKMIIASPADPGAWIAEARRLGARAWYRTDPTTPEWQFRAKKHEDPQAENYQPPRKRVSGLHGGYDRDALIADLKRGYDTKAKLAEKYQVSKTTITNICKELGLAPGPSNIAKINRQLAQIDRAAVIADIRADAMTKGNIAKKHGVAQYVITRIQKEEGLVGTLTFHQRQQRARSGGRPQLYNYNPDRLVADMREAAAQGWTKLDVARRHGIPLSTLAGVQQKYSVWGTFAMPRKEPRPSGGQLAPKANKKAP